MSKPFSEYLGARPFLYGRDLLKRMGVQGHYVDENDVLDFLGYETRPLNPEEHRAILEMSGIGDIFDDTCAITFYHDSIMFISESLPFTRKRCTVFHETGHDLNDFHPKGIVSISKDSEIDSASYKIIERDAFYAGSEVMFPLKHFLADSTSLPLELSSIDSIAQKYAASYEATGIRYALTNQNIMALLVVKENDFIANMTSSVDGQIIPQNQLPMQISPSLRPNRSSTTPAPLRVQYCVRSHHFPKFIKSGTEIGKSMCSWSEEGEENLIHKSWRMNLSLTGEIPASVFGSSQAFSYTAECRPINGRVFVLLSLPDKQIKLFNGASL